MKRIKQNNAMAVKLGIKGLKSSLDAMQCKRSPPTDSYSEYDLNSDSELEGDLSQCSSLVEESEEDALSYSPIKVLALTFQGYIGRTYLATDALHCFYFVELSLAWFTHRVCEYAMSIVMPLIQSYTNYAHKCVRLRSGTHGKISQHNSKHKSYKHNITS